MRPGEQAADRLTKVLRERMSLGTSGRWIAEYRETPDTLAAAVRAHYADQIAAAEQRGRDEVTARVAEVTEDLWRVTPCGCGHRADLHGMFDHSCIGGLTLCKCAWTFPRIVAERLRHALAGGTR